jgi:hypothetical protein
MKIFKPPCSGFFIELIFFTISALIVFGTHEIAA